MPYGRGESLEGIQASGTVRFHWFRFGKDRKHVIRFFRYVIHTVGPRYNEKYKTAAESALFSCYRSVLQLCRSIR